MFDLDRELTDEELLFVRGQETRPNEGNITSTNNFVLRDSVMTSLRGWTVIVTGKQIGRAHV